MLGKNIPDKRQSKAFGALCKGEFLLGRSFVDLEDLNCQAIAWCKSVNSRPHGTTCESPLQKLAQEELLVLPS